MKCRWQDVAGTTDERGWRLVVCKRANCIHGEGGHRRLKPTPNEHTKIHAECLGTPAWHELGAWTEIMLQVVGLHKQRWLWLKGKFGLVPACGCEQRQERLDGLGHRLQVFGLATYRRLGRLYGDLRQKLFPKDKRAAGGRNADRHPAASPDSKNLDADVPADDDPLPLRTR